MKLIVALLCALFFSSCVFTSGDRAVTGSGNVKTETRNVSGFKGINASSALDVEVEQADSFQVVVEADDNVIHQITTRVENGVLYVETEINSFRNVKSKKIKVKMPEITSLEASSAASISSINILISDKLTLDASSAAQIDINAEAETIISNSSSASSIEIKGKALKFSAESSSASEIDADELLVNDVTANASSAGTISVHPILNLNAEANSGASITYNTVPRNNLTEKADSGGSVSKNN